MKLSDIPYPLRLCVELMHYCAIGGQGMTDGMTGPEIKEIVGRLFPRSQIDEAIRILAGESDGRQ